LGSNRKEIMATKVITIIIDTVDQSLETVLAAAINEVHSLGHTVKSVRVADDAGEQVVPTNQIAGVTVPAPSTGDTTAEATPPVAPAPSETPAVPDTTVPADVPVDVPVDPTSVTTTPSDPSTT
jgi:hypothetical protein